MAKASKKSGQGGAESQAPAQTFADVKTILDSINDGVFTVDAGFRVTSFNRAAQTITGVSAAQAVGRRCWEVFRADICEGQCALKQTIATSQPVVNKPIRILTADGRGIPISVSTALLKDADGRIMGGVETFRDLSLMEQLRKEAEGRYAFHDMISADPRMKEVFQLLPLVAESGSTALITGESGTGKELVARAIHDLSPRHRGPLVTVNCAALPETLLESELFGYVAGAFTDARRDRQGRIEAAEGGSLFLDEIGDVPPSVQVRLLRLLQEKTFERLGSNRAIKADVRFIAATHRDLRREIQAGRFREDLYYRLNVMQIAIPPLRERPEDIPLLVRHFLGRLNRLHGRDVQGVSPEAMARLMGHSWPGNVRELENAVEHAFVLCRQGLILEEYLPAGLSGPPEAALLRRPAIRDLREVESSLIHAALERHRGNRSAAARELGIHKTTLWRKLRRERREGL
jgi:PAS domain S-box-containing protein